MALTDTMLDRAEDFLVRADRMPEYEALVALRAAEASKAATTSNAAPRQAPDEATTTRADTVETFERMGIAVGVRDLTPANAGYGVRLQLHESFVVLDPTEAANLGAMLQHAAQDAIHADRAARR